MVWSTRKPIILHGCPGCGADNFTARTDLNFEPICNMQSGMRFRTGRAIGDSGLFLSKSPSYYRFHGSRIS